MEDHRYSGEQCAEEDIWTCRRENIERMEIITYFTVS